MKIFKACALVLLVLCLGFTAFAVTPGGSVSTSSQGAFKHASPFSFNYVFDWHYIWIPVAPMNFVVTSDSDVTSTVKGIGGGAQAFTEIGSSDIMGLTLDADAEDFSVMIPCPTDCDWAQATYVRVLYSESSSTAGTVLFALSYKQLTADSTVMAVASTTTGVTDGSADATLTTGNEIQWANWSTIAANNLSCTGGQDLLIMKFDVDLTTVTDSTVYGVQVKCARKWLGGDNL